MNITPEELANIIEGQGTGCRLVLQLYRNERARSDALLDNLRECIDDNEKTRKEVLVAEERVRELERLIGRNAVPPHHRRRRLPVA